MATLDRPTAPELVLAELWERTSAKGGRYYSGFLNSCRILLLDAGERPHPTREGETVRVWRLVLQERDREPGARRAVPRGTR